MEDIITEVGLDAIRKGEFDDDPNGRFLEFEPPKRNAKYVVGVDVSTGVGLTNSVAHVLRVGTMYEPFIQVGEFACNFLDPHGLAPILDLLGRRYWNDDEELPALMCIECNNAGESTQFDLMTIYNYPNIFIWKVYDKTGNLLTNKLGWWTTPRTRRKIVLYGSRLLKSGMWQINSPWFVDEMADFELQRGVGNMLLDSEIEAIARHKAGALDDRLMAGFIAVWCAQDLREADYADPIVEHQKFKEREALQAERVAAGLPRKDYQNTAMSYREMRELEEL